VQFNSYTAQRKVSPNLGDPISQASVLKVDSSQNSIQLDSRTSAKKIMGKRNKNRMNKLEMYLQVWLFYTNEIIPFFNYENTQLFKKYTNMGKSYQTVRLHQ